MGVFVAFIFIRDNSAFVLIKNDKEVKSLKIRNKEVCNMDASFSNSFLIYLFKGCCFSI